jgi:hypothetical protein
MEPAAGIGDARDVLVGGDVGRAVRPALEVADDQQAVLGRYSTTGAPAPAAAAVTEFRYSQSRSMASSSLPPEEIRATKLPSGVLTL